MVLCGFIIWIQYTGRVALDKCLIKMQHGFYYHFMSILHRERGWTAVYVWKTFFCVMWCDFNIFMSFGCVDSVSTPHIRDSNFIIQILFYQTICMVVVGNKIMDLWFFFLSTLTISQTGRSKQTRHVLLMFIAIIHIEGPMFSAWRQHAAVRLHNDVCVRAQGAGLHMQYHYMIMAADEGNVLSKMTCSYC